MSKVVKILATVAAVALAIPTGGTSLLAYGLGVSSVAATAIVVGLTVGASLLAKRPKAPRTPPESIERLNASIDPRTPRKMVFGITAMATDIRDQEYTNSQEYLHRFIVVAAHKVNAISEIWFDDKIAWSASGGVQGEYVGYLTVAPILEGNAGNAINISARMGTSRRYTGCAYVHLRYKLTGNTKKTESPFSQGIPTRITIRGNGAYVYDPRKDSTVPGGSGSHRADNQATWEWTSTLARNPALQMLTWMLGWRINGILSVGLGIPAARIDLVSFIDAANLCDETVTLAVGGTEPRYRGDGLVSEATSPSTIIDAFKATMNADLDDVGGKLRLTVFHNDLADPVADFDDDDMISGFKWRQTPSLDESFNVVRGSFTDPSDTSLYQHVTYPQVEIASPDGIERADQFDLAFVQSPSQAQRLAKQRLQRQLYGGQFETTFNARGWLVQKNSVVRLTFTRLGWTNKLFRVAEMEHRVDGTCPIILREENADIYAWDAEESAPVVPADPTEYDFTLSPIYQQFETIGDGADGASAFTLSNVANTEFPTPNSVRKTGGGSAWNGKAITVDRHPGAIVTVIATPGGQKLVGLDTEPGDSSEFANIRYALNFDDVTFGVQVNNNGTPAYTSSAAFWADGDALTVWTDGKTTVSYRKNGVEFFNQAISLADALHHGVVAIYGVGESVSGFAFAAVAAPGISPPLITVATTHNTFRYDADDAPLSQTTTIKATRQNTSGVTQWRYLDASGTPQTVWMSAADMVAAAGADSAPDNDTLVLNQARFQANIAAYGSTGIIVETRISTATGVQDRVSLVKVRDGDNAITAFLTNESHTLAAAADGTVSGYAGASGTFKIEKNGVDISSNFTLSTQANPQTLTVGYTGMAYSVTAGFDAGEDNATLTIRATGSGVFAGITIDKVFSLSKSKTGNVGAPGDDALTVSMVPPAISVPCTFNGTPKAAVPGFQITVFQGSTNVSASATYGTIVASGVSGAAVDGDGTVTVTGMTADTGYVEVPITYAGISATARVGYAKVKDGNAAVSGSANVTSLANSGTYASSANFNITLANGQTLNCTANVSYLAASGTYTSQMKLAYVNVTDGGAETDMSGSEATGGTATTVDPETNSTSGSFTNSSGGTKVFNIRLLTRRSAGSGNSTSVTGSVGGSG